MTNDEIALKIMEVMGEEYIQNYCNQHNCSVVEAFATIIEDINKFNKIRRTRFGIKLIRKLAWKLKREDTK